MVFLISQSVVNTQQQNNIPWNNSTEYGVSGDEKNKSWVAQCLSKTYVKNSNNYVLLLK